MRREEKEEAGQGGEVRGKENERVVRRGVRGAKKEEQKGGGEDLCNLRASVGERTVTGV